jgi:spore germination cell wall hydrolase CwlJ-like protein
MRNLIKSVATTNNIIVVLILVIVALVAHITFSKPTSFDSKRPLPEMLSRFEAKEVNCLASNIYFEARGSNLADKAAVADVVMNRTEDRRYPTTVCAVVSQGVITGKTDCQFSWKCDSRSNMPAESDSWEEAKSIAYNMYVHKEFRGITEGATHYHATYVKPYWAKSLQLVGRIGSHVYYRWE